MKKTKQLNSFFFLFGSYKQQKFNLMREETEGFAKLVLELNLEATKPLELQSSSRLYDNVLALIGTCCLYLYLPMSIFFFFFL